MILLTLAVIEILAQTSYYVIFKERYSLNNLLSQIKQERNKLHQADFFAWEIIHPYLGYVWDFSDNEKNNRSQGFTTTPPLVAHQDKNSLNVALVGGSVAANLGTFLEDEFKRVSGLSPRIICLAIGGHKQPQQLLALNYYMAQGAEYDLIINVDGFNDIVLPIVENRKAGINPFFPRGWSLRLSRYTNEKMNALWKELKKAVPEETQFVAGLSQGFGRQSAIYGILNWAWFKKLSADIGKAQEKMMDQQSKMEKSFEEAGPSVHYREVNQLYHALAEFWARSSLLIDNLARGNGMEYYHFLQPNQYYENSKDLNEEELRTAYMENQPYRQPAAIGYPILVNLGKSWLKNKINYFDATMLFSPVKETIYIDNCCHYNKKGNKMFAAYIVSNILARTNIGKLKSSLKSRQEMH